MAELKTQPSGKTWVMVLQFVLPVVLAIIGGYVTVRSTASDQQKRSADNEQKIVELERRVKADEDGLTKLNDQMVTSREFKLYMDTQTQTLGDIRADIRAIRAGQK